jgi:hypothetical protein
MASPLRLAGSTWPAPARLYGPDETPRMVRDRGMANHRTTSSAITIAV